MSKIYQKDIHKIPASNFKSKVKIKVDGKYQEMHGMKLKNYMKGLMKGGKTIGQVERHLKLKGGMVGAQYKKREEILKMLRGGELTLMEKRAIERAEKEQIKKNIQSQKASSRLFDKDKQQDQLRGGETKFISSGVASALSKTSDKSTSAIKTNARKTGFSGAGRLKGNATRKGPASRSARTSPSARGIGASNKIGLSS